MSNIEVDVVYPSTSGNAGKLRGNLAGAATTNGIDVDSSGNTTATGALTMPRNEGLVVKYVTAATVDIDADYLTVFDTNDLGKVLSSINLTLTVSGTGANGRSASENSGSEKASDWYHLWVIWNGTTTACYATLASDFATVLADLPSGYTHAKYVGAVYNDGSSNFVNFHQVGNEVSGTSGDVSTSVTSSLVNYALTAFVPETATAVLAFQYAGASATTGNVALSMQFANDATANLGQQSFASQYYVTAIDSVLQATCWVTMTTAQQVAASQSPATAGTTLAVRGWAYSNIV